jgi:hypothetical protein
MLISPSKYRHPLCGLFSDSLDMLLPALAVLQFIFSPRQLSSGSVHVQFEKDNVAMGPVFPSTSVCPANSHSTECSISLINQPGPFTV